MDIIIVDDNDIVREFLVDAIIFILNKKNKKVKSFSNCATAWRYINNGNGKPGLIISDVDMSGMTGLEFLAKVKEKFPDIKFIVMSGNHFHEERAIQLNSDGFLAKPFTIEHIINIL